MAEEQTPPQAAASRTTTGATSRPRFERSLSEQQRAFTSRAKILAAVALRSGARDLAVQGDPRLLTTMEDLLRLRVEDPRMRDWLVRWFAEEKEPAASIQPQS